jgi:Siroheme synthase (precorrin-2 oxidase/ferrochelatase domain)
VYENNTKDILCSGVEHIMLSLISEKIDVLIVGGGKAALTKIRTFADRGCKVSIVSKEFLEEFEELKKYKNISFIDDEYNKKYIQDKHLVIIATNCEKVNKAIRVDCKELYKLFIDCSDPKEGTCITPCQRNTKNIFFGLHTKSVSPKTSVYLANKIKNKLVEYDEFISFSSSIRNRIKDWDKKQEIMNFICSDDFYFFYEKKKEEPILKMFYPMAILSNTPSSLKSE